MSYANVTDSVLPRAVFPTVTSLSAAASAWLHVTMYTNRKEMVQRERPATQLKQWA